MNLRKRISKLQNEGKHVELNNYSLISFEGYYADRDVRAFWLWSLPCVILIFFAFWIGNNIYTSNQAKKNPAYVQAITEKSRQQAENDRKSKAQYIQGCKDAGKSPGDMSDEQYRWGCK